MSVIEKAQRLIDIREAHMRLKLRRANERKWFCNICGGVLSAGRSVTFDDLDLQLNIIWKCHSCERRQARLAYNGSLTTD